MKQVSSVYEAIVGGKVVRAESSLVHEDKAEIHIVFKKNERICSYVNPIEEGITCPNGYRVKAYPATKVSETVTHFWREKVSY